MIHTVKGFNAVNEAEVKSFLEFLCFYMIHYYASHCLKLVVTVHVRWVYDVQCANLHCLAHVDF